VSGGKQEQQRQQSQSGSDIGQRGVWVIRLWRRSAARGFAYSHTHTHSLTLPGYSQTHTQIQRDICLRSVSVCFMFCVIVASSKNTKIFISNESCAQLGTAETGKQNDFSAQPPAATPTKRPREIPCKWVESMICPNLLISF